MNCETPATVLRDRCLVTLLPYASRSSAKTGLLAYIGNPTACKRLTLKSWSGLAL